MVCPSNFPIIGKPSPTRKPPLANGMPEVVQSRSGKARLVAVRADGPGSATLVRLMAVESGRSVLRAANPGRPNLEVTRANETMIRAVVVFVGRAV